MRKSLNASSCKGASVVEFALISIIYFMVLFGIIDFGRYMFVMATISYAAQEGARTGQVGSTASQIVTKIQTTAGWAVTPSDLLINFYTVTAPTFTDPTNPNVQIQGAGGAYMRLKVQYTFTFLAPYIRPLFTNGTKTIKVSVLYKNENFI